jgi:23S rRNA pseudouridine2605 synthase/23S rRNA pseudouridine2604 synthase
MTMRLQKYLAHAGICSRRRAETHILAGKVTVNGHPVTTLGTSVSPGTDQICFEGQPVTLNPDTLDHIYIVVNKPKGYVTSCSQENTRIILDLVPVRERIYPVGRLDKDSTGLVLLTNDGALHNRLSHPSYDHEKEYLVTTVHPVRGRDLAAMARGMVIDGKRTRKAVVKRLGKKRFKIILKQGRNRQIRKMVGKTGNQVAALHRVRMARISLGSLKPGAWRPLSQEEVKLLLNSS